ncbi:hypothetical protein ACSEPQ_04670 [Pseudomonas aeruginosa]
MDDLVILDGVMEKIRIQDWIYFLVTTTMTVVPTGFAVWRAAAATGGAMPKPNRISATIPGVFP